MPWVLSGDCFTRQSGSADITEAFVSVTLEGDEWVLRLKAGVGGVPVNTPALRTHLLEQGQTILEA
jgi:hypothetical protein